MCQQPTEGIVGRSGVRLLESHPPPGPPGRARLHGPPHPSRERESKVSAIGETSHGIRTGLGIEEPRDAPADLGCDAIGLKRHWHKMLTDLMIIRNVNIESKTRIKGKPLDK